jgi:hypothetical protein
MFAVLMIVIITIAIIEENTKLSLLISKTVFEILFENNLIAKTIIIEVFSGTFMIDR